MMKVILLVCVFVAASQASDLTNELRELIEETLSERSHHSRREVVDEPVLKMRGVYRTAAKIIREIDEDTKENREKAHGTLMCALHLIPLGGKNFVGDDETKEKLFTWALHITVHLSIVFDLKKEPFSFGIQKAMGGKPPKLHPTPNDFHLCKWIREENKEYAAISKKAQEKSLGPAMKLSGCTVEEIRKLMNSPIIKAVNVINRAVNGGKHPRIGKMTNRMYKMITKLINKATKEVDEWNKENGINSETCKDELAIPCLMKNKERLALAYFREVAKGFGVRIPPVWVLKDWARAQAN